MNLEEELRELKRVQAKNARLTSWVLGFAGLVAIMFMLYGFAQSIEANKQRMIAEAYEKEALKAQARLLKTEGMLKETVDSLEVARRIIKGCEEPGRRQ